MAEPTLQELHDKFADDQGSSDKNNMTETPQSPQPSDDWSDDDFDDYDDELASALEWADLREDLQARGSNSSLPSFSGSQRTPNRQQPNSQGSALFRSTNKPSAAPTSGNMGKLNAHFNAGSVHHLDDLIDKKGGRMNVSNNVANTLRSSASAASGGRSKDRADRATVEQVLDPRTRMVLFKMLNRGVFSEINGCVSTGKEANVYHASSGDNVPTYMLTPGTLSDVGLEGVAGNTNTISTIGEVELDTEVPPELAIKVYKTAILVFKDRERYVVGDSRFQRYCKSNPRKMVKLWAEKEMRNLARLRSGGVPAPKPLLLRMHVLVMEFLGENGVAAPRLRDAGLPPARLRQAYTEMVHIVRNLYQRCRLVHADLSEYNILVHNNELYIIDVSQAVELDHPRAFDFLREDCSHVNDFFRRQNIPVLTTRELFEFTVDPSLPLNGPALDAEMDRLMEQAAERPVGAKLTPEEEIAERVWYQAYIPRKLEEVVHYERDHERLQEGGGNVEGIYYQALAGMKHDMSGARECGDCTPVEKEGTGQGAATVPSSGVTAGGEEEGEDRLTTPMALSPLLGEGGVGGGEEPSSSKKKVRFAPGTKKGTEYGYDDIDNDGSGDSDGIGEWVERVKMTKDEIRAARKEHKKAVKEANAARRTTKTPKHVKRKAEKANKKK